LENSIPATYKEIVNEGRRVLRILQSPLPVSLKRKVLITEGLLTKQRLGSTVGDRNHHGVVQTCVLDYEVTAPTLALLSYLYSEIFIDLQYFFKSDKPDPFILDCGSNIGLSILFFKTLYPKANIIGFEPAEPTYTLLQKNIVSNGLKGVHIHQLALGAENSKVDLFFDPESDDVGSLTMSTIKNRSFSNDTSTLVRQAKLSSFIDREVDFLKLDVEGAEDTVLQDLVFSGAISRIEQMVVEYHHHVEKNRDAFGRFLSYLEDNGFGYQILAWYPARVRSLRGRVFQDVQVYAYQKR
jgi:FkbM family methyltransferase